MSSPAEPMDLAKLKRLRVADLKELLAANAGYTWKDELGMTALHVACSRGRVAFTTVVALEMLSAAPSVAEAELAGTSLWR